MWVGFWHNTAVDRRSWEVSWDVGKESYSKAGWGQGNRKGGGPLFCSPHPEHAGEGTSHSKSGKIGFGCQEVKFHSQSVFRWALWFTRFVPPPSHGFDFYFTYTASFCPSLWTCLESCVGRACWHLWSFPHLVGTMLGTQRRAHTETWNLGLSGRCKEGGEEKMGWYEDLGEGVDAVEELGRKSKEREK